MRGGFRIGRLFGFDLRVHYTWFLALGLISWSLAGSFFPQQYPGWSAATYWWLGIVAALFLFVSVLLHELAHSLVARARDLPVGSITLFIFGGVSNLEEEPQTPGIEFTMALVGPLTSIFLGFVLWGVIFLLAGMPVSFGELFIGNKLNTPLEALIGYLALINMVLGVFNLMPGFPLDGGRVLRSVIWGATGNLSRATTISSTVGRLMGWVFIAFGVFQLFTGNVLGGIWIAFIGWFLNSAADASRRDLTLREHLSGIPVSRVLAPDKGCVSPELSVEDVVRDVFFRQQRRAVPVCRDNKLEGILTLTDVRELPQEKWAQAIVAEIMTKNPLFSVAPEDDLSTALHLIAQHDINQVLVLRQGQLEGIISRADIIRYLQVSKELGLRAGGERS
ncbi:site-2 protease family protein [Chloroflexota bacterium]